LSTYPRCPESISPPGLYKDACIHIIERTAFGYMGYSLRTERWRYTEYVRWNGSALMPMWDQVFSRELYDHQGDDGVDYDGFEMKNQLDEVNRTSPEVLPMLAAKLREVAGAPQLALSSTGAGATF
jgi:hypothetical protein